MNTQSHRFSNEKLLEILALSQNATAIYTGEEITIQAANNVMIGFWGKDRSVIGKPLAEAVPELVGQPFLDILREVWRTGITYEAKDAEALLLVDGKLQTFYFDFVYRAINNEAGEIDCILHTATDVTELNLGRNLVAHAKEQQEALEREQVLNQELGTSNEELSAANEELAAAMEELSATNDELQLTKDSLQALNDELERRVAERTKKVEDLYQELETLNKELRASNEELVNANEELSVSRESLEKLVVELAGSENRTRSIIEAAPFPIGVYTGREMRITFVNKAITDVWGKGDNLTGRLYAEVLPELDNQEVFKQLDDVYTSGISFEARNQRIDLAVEGELKTFYFNYNFTALRNEAGEVYGVMNTAADVTDVVVAKQQLEKYAYELASLNEELTASNEEQVAVNLELKLLYEKLKISQDEQHELINELSASERKFRTLIKKAPVAINVFRTRELIIESVNDKMLEIWGKTDGVEGKTFTEALPEIANQPFIEILRAVFETGEPYYGLENKAVIIKDGIPEDRYFNFIYQPIAEKDGSVGSVLQVVTEVTDQVNSKREIAEVNTRLNIAIEAGGLGSTEVDLATGKMECNEQFKKYFGRTSDQPFTYTDLFEAMLPQYRKKVKALVATAIEKNSLYESQYEVAWPDGSIHWISAHGRARYDNNGNAIKMVGIISDITEAKADEQRKNDFIGMVSHELKTPLTSLTAYMQILQAKARKNSDNFASGALDMANKQVKKMTTMINGFLNVSRLESGKIHIDSQRFDMAGLVKEIEEESAVTITSHNVIFAPVEETPVYADRDKIGQVINNFISNAVKYSPMGSTIHIACLSGDGSVQVSVQDEGRGISPEDQQKLFERYYRVKDQPATISGFGIGLYVCAEIINRHNGNIWLESEPDKGSTFYFSLPV
ncbi:PAS domain-containing protein [Mucilaginibacter xinganensis]|uniref:histidine kinase n=1 Tax=Mucilaginibacter xinganensis TaxID=1234841 RepID=A0A223NTG5_9SPHI|nr:PAS domain-containing protein [Mucilaginibacter xinganensis]ASU33185.1 PAS domain-containing sensor histidine kinase [Mucilaginibacter xinganensis]